MILRVQRLMAIGRIPEGTLGRESMSAPEKKGTKEGGRLPFRPMRARYSQRELKQEVFTRHWKCS